MHAKPIVFLGSTISVAEASSILDAIYLPPVAQGDVVRAVQRHNPICIVIIDGAFQTVPAVRHREILWAMHKKIPIVGAASMGALRAAELAPFGMIGMGLIYRWYRRYAFAADDAVAVLHGPLEFGSQSLTLAHVDLRMAVKFAYLHGVINHGERRRLEALSSALHYRDRTWDTMIEAASQDKADKGSDLLKMVKATFVSQKKRDAVAALEFVANAKQPINPPQQKAGFKLTSLFVRDLAHAGLSIN